MQNGRRNERLTFDTVDPYAGVHIQAVGFRGADDFNSAEGDDDAGSGAARGGGR